MVFVSLCNRLQQIEFRSMLRFLFFLANESLLLLWECQLHSEPMYLPLRGCGFGGEIVLIETSVLFICPRTWFSFKRRWGFFLSKKGHFQPRFHSRPGNSMRNCEMVYLKPRHNKYHVPTRGFWRAVCDLSFHSLLLKMWMECYDKWFCFSNAIFVTICFHIIAKWNWQTLILLLSQSICKGLSALIMLICMSYDLV